MSELDADGLCSAVQVSGDDGGEYWSELAENEYALASFSSSYEDYGLSPDFRGRNFSDDVAAIRDPMYRGGKYTPRGARGRGFRGRSRGRSLSRGSFEQRTDSRYDSGENFSSSPAERGKVQCFKCKLYGHYSRECREKPQGYLALSKPFSTGNAEVLAASAETPSGSKGSKKGKSPRKKTVAAVEEKFTELN